MNLPNFLYGSCSDGPLSENHNLYAWKILIWRIFGHGIAKFCPFSANFRVLGLLLPNALLIFLIFGMEVVAMVLFEKIILYIPGKF